MPPHGFLIWYDTDIYFQFKVTLLMLININITLIVPDSVDWSDYDLLGCVTGLYFFTLLDSQSQNNGTGDDSVPCNGLS